MLKVNGFWEWLRTHARSELVQRYGGVREVQDGDSMREGQLTSVVQDLLNIGSGSDLDFTLRRGKQLCFLCVDA